MKEIPGPISIIIGSALLGALALSLLSIPQKMALGADPYSPEGFIVPCLFGGIAGFLLGLIYNRLLRKEQKLEEARRQFQRRDLQYREYFHNHILPMLLIDPDNGEIVDANTAARNFYGYGQGVLTSLNITDINTLSQEEIFKEMALAKSQDRHHFHFKHRLANNRVRDVEVYSGPILVGEKKLLYSVVSDVTERKQVEAERERLIHDLQAALTQIKTLSGLLPICSHCKKVRDDEGYWQQIEEYIGHHSDAEFSHSICPECMEKYYDKRAGQSTAVGAGIDPAGPADQTQDRRRP